MGRRGYANTELGQVHYRESGVGEPLVLLHMTASSSVMFTRCIPLLARRFRVIALDTPGFGLSDAPAERPEISDYARSLAAALEELGVERASIVGFHTGGTIALELAARFPRYVSRLVLAAILVPKTGDERTAWGELLLRPWEPDGKGEFLDHVLWWLGNYVPEHDGEAYLAELIGTLQAGPTYWWGPRAVIEYDAFARLGELELPILFLTPCADNLAQDTHRAHAACPGSSYVEVPGNDAAPWEFPDEFCQAVVDFVGAE